MVGQAWCLVMVAAMLMAGMVGQACRLVLTRSSMERYGQQRQACDLNTGGCPALQLWSGCLHVHVAMALHVTSGLYRLVWAHKDIAGLVNLNRPVSLSLALLCGVALLATLLCQAWCYFQAMQ
jgi:hypothetical protein